MEENTIDVCLTRAMLLILFTNIEIVYFTQKYDFIYFPSDENIKKSIHTILDIFRRIYFIKLFFITRNSTLLSE